MRKTHLLAAALVAALAVPAVAQAADYPPAANPKNAPGPRKGKGKTFQVCKKRGCKYKTISAAVRKARGGDTIKVANGTYREGVKILGPRYDGLKLIGNTKNPRRVVLNGRGVKGTAADNGVLVNNADRVKIAGFTATYYKANGFLVTNANGGYTMTRLYAHRTGAYGIFAFNSKGGTISNSTATENNDSGFYIGQTPRQTKPRRSIVTNVTAYKNVLGWSGTNMRYVTIRKSSFYNNGAGIVPNALTSEKFPPPESNVISGNKVFWNNYNYYRAAPFKVPTSGPAGLPGYPIGVGILLFGSQKTIVEKNQIFGNWLTGFGAIEQLFLTASSDPALKEAGVLRSNVVRNNKFGLGGKDLNGRDMFYDGSGTRNCFSGNSTRSPNLPASNGTFAPCPGPASNTLDPAARNEALGWVLAEDPKDPSSFERFWIRKPHARQKGLRPVTSGGS